LFEQVAIAGLHGLSRSLIERVRLSIHARVDQMRALQL
jgi:hypothetical protein